MHDNLLLSLKLTFYCKIIMSAFVCLATRPLFTLVYKDRFTCTCIFKVYIFTFRLPFIKKKHDM